MFEVAILVPVADNDGNIFAPDHDASFELLLCEKFGGFSRSPGLASGGWVEGERLYRDDLRVYSVAVGSITEGAKIAEVVEMAKRHFRQEAIYIRYLGLSEIL